MSFLRRLLGVIRSSSNLVASQPKAAYTLPELLGKLSDRDWNVRYRAAAEIGQLGDPQAVPGLLSALANVTNEDPSHTAMIQALGEIGDERALPLLVSWLNRTSRKAPQNPSPRAAAALALGNMRKPSAARALLEAFQKESGDLGFRTSVLQAFDKLGEPIASAVESMLNDRRCPEAVIELAAKRAGAPAVAPLVRLIGTAENIFQGAAAVKALEELMAKHIADVDIRTLRQILALEDNLTIYPDSDYGAVGTLNCTSIKSIARQEIERRK